MLVQVMMVAEFGSTDVGSTAEKIARTYCPFKLRVLIEKFSAEV